jgi:hypothetical protein
MSTRKEQPMGQIVHVECVDCGSTYDQRLQHGEGVSCCGACGGDQIEVTNVYPPKEA